MRGGIQPANLLDHFGRQPRGRVHRQVEGDQIGFANRVRIERFHAQVRAGHLVAALGNPRRGRCQAEWLVAELIGGDEQNLHATTFHYRRLLQPALNPDINSSVHALLRVRDSKTLKLLIVEDSLEDEQLLCEALLEIEENRQWCNWRSSSIVPVDRLSDALDCVRRDSFDAILLNLSLPDSPALLDSFLDVSACAGSTPILVLADEPDENLANRLLREGAQDVLVKSELECAPLARAIRYAIERQRELDAARASAFVDHLTGVLTRDAFLECCRATAAAERATGARLRFRRIAKPWSRF